MVPCLHKTGRQNNPINLSKAEETTRDPKENYRRYPLVVVVVIIVVVVVLLLNDDNDVSNTSNRDNIGSDVKDNCDDDFDDDQYDHMIYSLVPGFYWQ